MLKKYFRSTPYSGFAGAAFLMATSAIGPGFITQTTVFTHKLKADFGFVILVSILIDIVVQLNIWRAVAISGLKAPVMANNMLNGLGTVLSLMVLLGGVVFNMGNIAGCGLGLQALFGVEPLTGAIISGGIAIAIFLIKEFGKAMDQFARWLGFIMIFMVVLVAIYAHPPVTQMVTHSVLPTHIDAMAILTLVGGTVGGYISFAGAHRMLDANKGDSISLRYVNRSAVTGIALSGIMRIGLFAASLGVIMTGFTPDPINPPASIFQQALGNVGLRIFGVILWAAAITSVVGASYTSVSFLENWHPLVERKKNWFIIGFILLATLLFALFGKPVNVLIAAGAINGFVLPLALSIVLLFLMKKHIRHQQPRWLTICGWVVFVFLCYLSFVTLLPLLK